MAFENFSLGNELRCLNRQLVEMPKHFLFLIVAEDPCLSAIADWTNVLEFISSKPVTDPGSDLLIRAIFLARRRQLNNQPVDSIELRRQADGYWKTVFTVVFARALAFLHRKKARHWDRDPSDLWSNVLLAFLEAVDKFDVTQGSNRIGKKILNSSYHKLYQGYVRKWRYESKIQVGENSNHFLDHGAMSIGYAIVDLRDAIRTNLELLRRAYHEGRLTKIEFDLIRRTRLSTIGLKEAAALAGISYELARKRRQRAEAAIGWNFSIKKFLQEPPSS
jgi:hypothetical protein